MTMGPEPMTRILWMDVSLGMESARDVAIMRRWCNERVGIFLPDCLERADPRGWDGHRANWADVEVIRHPRLDDLRDLNDIIRNRMLSRLLPDRGWIEPG